MGFFKKTEIQGLVKEKLKKEWAVNIYKNINLMKEAEGLALETDEVLIEQMIEKIFQSAKDNEIQIKSKGFKRWENPIGIAYGAVNLIKPTDTKEKKLFVTLIAFAVIQQNWGIQFNDNGMRRVFKDNGWTVEETDRVLNYK